MPLVTFTYADPTGTGTDTPSVGKLFFSLAVRDASTGIIRTTSQFEATLIAGQATVNLSPSTADNAWMVIESGIEGARTTYYQVPNLPGPLTQADCTIIDPTTFTPSDSGAAAWASALVAAQTAASTAATAATSAAASATLAGSYSTAYVPLATSNLPQFRKKLALTRLNQSPTRVLCVGDSTTAGVFSDSYTTATGSTNQGGPNSWPAQLAAQLNASGISSFYGLAIPGHSGNLDSRWSMTGGWAYVPFGFGINACLSASGTGVITITPGVAADTYKVWFAADSGTGQMTAQATGGSVSGAFGSNATAGAYSVTVTAGAVSASNTVTITWVSGTVFVSGIEWSDSTKPNRLSIGNAGVGSSKATQWAGDLTHYAKAIALIKAYAPDLTIISLGINDIAAGDTVANVTAAISNIVTAAQISGDVLLLSAFPHPTATALDSLNEALRTAVGVPALPYIDLFQRYGHNAGSQGFQTVDGTHPNAIGYADEASAIASFIRSL